MRYAYIYVYMYHVYVFMHTYIHLRCVSAAKQYVANVSVTAFDF